MVNVASTSALTWTTHGHQGAVPPTEPLLVGTVYDDGLEDQLRVTIVATGLGKPSARQQGKPQPRRRERKRHRQAYEPAAANQYIVRTQFRHASIIPEKKSVSESN